MASSPNETRYLTTADGIRIAWREMGEGRPVVLIHGYFSTAEVNWIKYGHAAAIATRGFRVIMPDLRGHGASDRPHDPAAYPPDVLMHDNLALVRHLGLTDYDLGGYSLGARTAVRMLANGATPRRVALSGMGLRGLVDTGGRGTYFRRVLTNLGSFERGTPEWLTEAFLKTTGGDAVALLRVLDTFVDTPLAAIEAIGQPTVVIAGVDDEDNGPAAPAAAPAQQAAAPTAAPTAAQAAAFVTDAEAKLAAASTDAQRMAWVQATYITDDTDALAAKSDAAFNAMQVGYALQAARFQSVAGLDPVVKRKLDLLRGNITLPAPTRPGAAEELSTLTTRMSSGYGKGRGTLDGKPINGSDIEAAMGDIRDPAKLQEMWTSWHDNVGAPMRSDYQAMTKLANEGAGALGYADVGTMWRSGYDMSPAEFAAATDRIWAEVQPLYLALHTYVRWKLNEKYGDAVQPKTGPIRADLLGNMWAQEWGNIYDIVAPKGAGDIGYDTGELLKQKGYDPVRMVRQGEAFYSSLGFQPLPDTFWQRSQIVKPADREVICHASAWDIDNRDDLRIKMCTKVNADDFVTIHHELGHNYYQRAYKDQPYLFKNGANDGFHEAIGDTVALSITPDYLVRIGLLDQARVPAANKDTGLLLRQAMDKVAFLPFGLLIDKWRWGVFSGEITPATYQASWDALRLRYQGIRPPVARDETRFDPGAKYHIPAGVPYMRYFLARVLQFQFYKAACAQAGWKGPLHRCSFYGNKAVGERLNAMLAMGQSKPWPDALQTFTGSRQMSGAALVEYFAPLKRWLDQQNKGKPQGW